LAAREEAFRVIEKLRGLRLTNAAAVAILHSGRVDDDVQQQAEGVDQDMPFAAGDLLGRIKALRVKRGAPFEPLWCFDCQ
jgi:hypothetical protein